ncbi:hypothetical protein HYT52_02890 [Candidatus Woesearchaeota archaeon]|nr:hypothetical protein [Candidatus Woesearchaeota archaeon]
MAWYQRTLKDMKKAIESEDWDKVKVILQQHNQSLDREAPRVEHDISDISLRVSQYGQDMDQIRIMLKAQIRGRNAKDDMLLKVESAINQAYFFERTILHLIKERKFMK